MNKPAPKEPSMDEILSSIRQIIADDDAAGARRPAPQAGQRPIPVPQAAIHPMERAGLRPSQPANGVADHDDSDDLEPLALSPSQIVTGHDDDTHAVPRSFAAIAAVEDEPETELYEDEEEAQLMADQPYDDADETGDEAETEGRAFDEPQLLDPEDVSFEAEDGEAEPETGAAHALDEQPAHQSVFAARVEAAQVAAPRRPSLSVSEAAPMPDRTLSADLAEKLIEPTTDRAVRHTLTRLSTLALGDGSATVEGLVRDLMRPMLKEWLDENLPSVVERMVEKEIARISRGVD